MSVWVSSGAFYARTVEALLAEATVRSVDAIELSSGFADSDGLEAALAAGLRAIEDCADPVGAQYKGQRVGHPTW